jgi:ABC-type antimicrobial peptide transport system permease subunit
MKDKSFTSLNLMGLSLGVAFSVIIFLLISYLTGFDTFHKNPDRIYRVITETLQNDNMHYSSGVPVPLGPRMQEDFAEIEKITSVFYDVGGLITITESDGSFSKYNENSGIAYLDMAFYEIFSRNVLQGDLKATLKQPDHVALSKKMAEKYFGEGTPIGKIINLNNSKDLVVGAILEDYSNNTHFPFEVMISYETYRRDNSSNMDNWNSNASDYQTYFLLKENSTAPSLSQKLPEIVEKYHADRPSGTLRYLLQPLADLHFDTRTSNYLYKSVPKSSILTMSIVGFLLLLTACINFINMATAQAIKRSREVGVRKVLGSSRVQLAIRFLGETALICLLALIVGLGLAELFLIEFNALLEVDLHIDQSGPGMIVFLFAAWLAMSFMAGLYPAMVMSGFSPIRALRSSISGGRGGSLNFRRGLVVFQFLVSQLLIISAIIIMTQTNYLKNAPMGFKKDLIVVTRLPEQNASKLSVLRNSLLSNSNVQNVSFGFSPPASGSVWGTYMKFPQTLGEENISVHVKMVDSSYLSTYELKLRAGRFLENSDTARNVVINETLAKMLVRDEPESLLGQNILMWGRILPIIGVVEDFHATSLSEPIAPLIFTNTSSRYHVAGVKINSENVSETLSQIESAWKEVFPQYVFDYTFLDEAIALFYRSQEKMSDTLLLFVAVTLFIGCLGLYGLISFMVNNKTKEVGIRKALGASTTQVMKIFVNELVILVVIAFVIAAPIAHILIGDWLNQFAYRIEIQAWMFIVTIVLVIIITFITVGYKSLRAAQANPVESLRTE